MATSKRPTTRTPAPAVAIRVHEVSGSSPKGWPEAAADALRRAKAEVPSPIALEIVRQWADVSAGRMTRFHVTARIAWAQTLRAAPATR